MVGGVCCYIVDQTVDKRGNIMATILETIQQRVSVRAYAVEPLSGAIIQELQSFLATVTRGVFGSLLRFQLLDESTAVLAELKKFGTYGMITGDRYYIAGAVEKGSHAELDFGYALEGIILKATELGLGTCWIGGTLKRSTFAAKLGLKSHEVIPAITPLGLAAERKPLKTRLIEGALQVRKRKGWETLFFDGEPGRVLTAEQAGIWKDALEAVRIGPSASNKQPWRIIRDGPSFHFCLDYDKLYNSVFKDFSIQKLDLGIAMCHFELVAREQGLSGAWQLVDPKPAMGNLLYGASWQTGTPSV